MQLILGVFAVGGHALNKVLTRQHRECECKVIQMNQLDATMIY